MFMRGDDGRVIHERSGDMDRVARWGDSAGRWLKLFSPVLSIIGALFIATVWQPLRSIPQVQQDIAAIKVRQIEAARIDSISITERGQLKQGLLVVTKILCLNLNRLDRIKTGINCSDVPLITTLGETP